RLRKVGFVEIQTAHAFTYQIRSEIVAKRYFKTEVIEQESLEFQISQLRAKTMRRKGKIRYEADASVMECPGEITVARRPTLIEENRAIYERYPYDFLRHIKAHREMLELASALVAEGSKVVDAGCGIGLLAEKVAGRCARYLGIDANPHFVEICRNRMRPYGNAEVVLGDLNNFRLEAEEFDCILALNVIYQEDIEPMPVLGMLRDALKPGGILVLSAPCSADSFKKCEKMMLADLDKEGALSGKDVIAEQIRAANARLLSPKGHYWSAGQISSLLRDIGFKAIERSDDSLYYGAAWLVAARR
ncbi:MAG: methyltransferase domain-containing protein, partial [Deltaproteobacteria bacterium]|nr:methyltransferase domain-containing protein [Deltaproteobacteria bacterium]